jgi:hypothetical protein
MSPVLAAICSTAAMSSNGARRKPGEQRLEARLDLAAAGGGQGGHGAAVKAAFHDDDGRPRHVAFVTVQAGDLDGGFVGLGAAVGEENPVHAGQRAQAVGQTFLLGNAVQVGGVHDGAGLGGDRAGDPGMRVAEAAHGDAGERVQITPALGVFQPGTLAADEGHVLALVGVHQMGHVRCPRWHPPTVVRWLARCARTGMPDPKTTTGSGCCLEKPRIVLHGPAEINRFAGRSGP